MSTAFSTVPLYANTCSAILLKNLRLVPSDLPSSAAHTLRSQRTSSLSGRGRAIANPPETSASGEKSHTMLAFLGVVLLLSLWAGPVWSSEEQPDRVSPRWASWFYAQEPQTTAQPAQAPVYQAHVTRTSYTPPVAPRNVRDLVIHTHRPRTQGVLASTTWLKGAFMTETEMADNQRENSIPGDTREDPASRMMRIGLIASSGPSRYGVTYRRAGQAFDTGPDQDLKEVWGEWKNRSITFRSAMGQQWNNIDGDPTRSRLEQNYGRFGLSWNQSLWPSLAVTYSRNALNSTLDPTGIAPTKMNNHTLEAALGYSGISWNVGLASSYILGADLLHNGSDNRIHMQTVTASLRPLNTLTIAPTLGYRTERQGWSGARIDSSSAALTMNYKQSQWLFLSAMGHYSGIRSSDRLIDRETIGGKGMVTVDIQQLRGWTTAMSLEGGINQQTNRVMSAIETQDISGILRLALTPL